MTAPLIYGYFAEVPQIDRLAETKLMLEWRKRWELAGFKPAILGEWDAMRHPYYHEYVEAVRKLPSINPASYDFHCYMRWLAVAQMLHEKDQRGFMADYDTFPNCKTWTDAERLIQEIEYREAGENDPTPIVCFQNCVPCF